MSEQIMFDIIREDLLSKGFQEQRGGSNYFNGEYATNLLSPEGEIVHISQNTFPDEEVVEDLFPTEQNNEGDTNGEAKV